MKHFISILFILCAIAVLLVSCMTDHVLLPGYNLHPTTRIYTPADGAYFMEGDTISFSGRGTDREDGILPEDSLVWASDIDGLIGMGTNFRRNDLSPNLHTITLIATDSEGRSDTSAVTIRVEEEPAVRVLFLGNSNFAYNNFTDVFRKLAESGNKKVIVDSHIIYGQGVDAHADDEGTEAKINSDQWDYVVIHGLCVMMAFPDSHWEFYPPFIKVNLKFAFTRLRNKIKANREETVMVYSMPWAYEDGLTWLPGRDEDYFEMQRLVYENTLVYSRVIPFMTAPVGWAWNRVMNSKWGEELHYLFLPDWGHPNKRGTFLMACVMYATLFKESPVDLPFQGAVTANEARYFKNVAAWTVMDSLELWNIIP